MDSSSSTTTNSKYGDDEHLEHEFLSSNGLNSASKVKRQSSLLENEDDDDDDTPTEVTSNKRNSVLDNDSFASSYSGFGAYQMRKAHPNKWQGYHDDSSTTLTLSTANATVDEDYDHPILPSSSKPKKKKPTTTTTGGREERKPNYPVNEAPWSSITDFYDEEDFMDAFRIFDTNGDGRITAKELNQVLKDLGICLNKKEIKKMIRDLDKDGNGTIEYSEFVQMMTMPASRETDEYELREAFKQIDLDGNGYLLAFYSISILIIKYIFTAIYRARSCETRSRKSCLPTHVSAYKTSKK